MSELLPSWCNFTPVTTHIFRKSEKNRPGVVSRLVALRPRWHAHGVHSMPLWNVVPAETKPRTHLRHSSTGVSEWPPLTDTTGVARLFRPGPAFPPPWAGGRNPPWWSGADPHPLLAEHRPALRHQVCWDSHLLGELLLDKFCWLSSSPGFAESTYPLALAAFLGLKIYKYKNRNPEALPAKAAQMSVAFIWKNNSTALVLINLPSCGWEHKVDSTSQLKILFPSLPSHSGCWRGAACPGGRAPVPRGRCGAGSRERGSAAALREVSAGVLTRGAQGWGKQISWKLISWAWMG